MEFLIAKSLFGAIFLELLRFKPSWVLSGILIFLQQSQASYIIYSQQWNPKLETGVNIHQQIALQNLKAFRLLPYHWNKKCESMLPKSPKSKFFLLRYTHQRKRADNHKKLFNSRLVKFQINLGELAPKASWRPTENIAHSNTTW